LRLADNRLQIGIWFFLDISQRFACNKHASRQWRVQDLIAVVETNR